MSRGREKLSIRRSRPSRAWLVGAITLALSLGAAPSALSQPRLRRSAPVQPFAAVQKGDWLIGLGAGHAANYRFPLLELEGDLLTIGAADLAYAPADGILIELRTDLYRAVTVERIGSSPPVTPDEGLADGKSTGSANLRLITLIRVLGDADGFAGGLHLEFGVPSGNQSEGLDTNTTDARVSGLVSYGRGRLRATADLGIAFLEAPLENFEQNDVVVYSGELLYGVSPRIPLRLYAGLDGRVSTRQTVPIGTEDLGELRLGGDYPVGRWLLDASASIGFAGISPDWGVGGGISLSPGRRSPR